MFAMTIQHRSGVQESIERKPWTSQDWRELSMFVAQSVGLVGAAIFLYSLGPALGMTLIAVGLAVWSSFRSQIAGDEEKDSSGEESGHASTVSSPSHCADPSWLRNGRLGMSGVADTRPVHRQGA